MNVLGSREKGALMLSTIDQGSLGFVSGPHDPSDS